MLATTTVKLADAVKPPPPSRRERRAGPGPRDDGRSLAELRRRLGGAQDAMMRHFKSDQHVRTDIHFFIG